MSLACIANRSLLLLALLAAGCSRQDPNKGEVKGMVMIDGQPAASGAVTFTPVDGQSSTSGGKIMDGQYSVQASTGTARVAIRVPKVVGERKLYDTADSPVRQVLKESLPSQYNDSTTLTFDVKPGLNEHNFELKSKNN
jgi:hypothetical protein